MRLCRLLRDRRRRFWRRSCNAAVEFLKRFVATLFAAIKTIANLWTSKMNGEESNDLADNEENRSREGSQEQSRWKNKVWIIELDVEVVEVVIEVSESQAGSGGKDGNENTGRPRHPDLPDPTGWNLGLGLVWLFGILVVVVCSTEYPRTRGPWTLGPGISGSAVPLPPSLPSPPILLIDLLPRLLTGQKACVGLTEKNPLLEVFNFGTWRFLPRFATGCRDVLKEGRGGEQQGWRMGDGEWPFYRPIKGKPRGRGLLSRIIFLIISRTFTGVSSFLVVISGVILFQALPRGKSKWIHAQRFQKVRTNEKRKTGNKKRIAGSRGKISPKFPKRLPIVTNRRSLEARRDKEMPIKSSHAFPLQGSELLCNHADLRMRRAGGMEELASSNTHFTNALSSRSGSEADAFSMASHHLNPSLTNQTLEPPERRPSLGKCSGAQPAWLFGTSFTVPHRKRPELRGEKLFLLSLSRESVSCEFPKADSVFLNIILPVPEGWFVVFSCASVFYVSDIYTTENGHIFFCITLSALSSFRSITHARNAVSSRPCPFASRLDPDFREARWVEVVVRTQLPGKHEFSMIQIRFQYGKFGDRSLAFQFDYVPLAAAVHVRIAMGMPESPTCWSQQKYVNHPRAYNKSCGKLLPGYRNPGRQDRMETWARPPTVPDPTYNGVNPPAGKYLISASRPSPECQGGSRSATA
ncbi:hypothetical protein CCUS01_15047 [Colletotrichum cuscutae]|uniref:Uncharacterized protein n=1 Tax=Colletotrichum cuscutae TaxID=1209917 RepID=A0AAI9VFL8_9PEZI|nr:hypothetical protein CCUS01_15047 [Colletotrichum cuscutae]